MFMDLFCGLALVLLFIISCYLLLSTPYLVSKVWDTVKRIKLNDD